MLPAVVNVCLFPHGYYSATAAKLCRITSWWKIFAPQISATCVCIHCICICLQCVYVSVAKEFICAHTDFLHTGNSTEACIERVCSTSREKRSKHGVSMIISSQYWVTKKGCISGSFVGEHIPFRAAFCVYVNFCSQANTVFSIHGYRVWCIYHFTQPCAFLA